MESRDIRQIIDLLTNINHGIRGFNAGVPPTSGSSAGSSGSNTNSSSVGVESYNRTHYTKETVDELDRRDAEIEEWRKKVERARTEHTRLRKQAMLERKVMERNRYLSNSSTINEKYGYNLPENIARGFEKARSIRNAVYDGKFYNTAIGRFASGAANRMEKMYSVSAAGDYVGKAMSRVGSAGGAINKIFGGLGKSVKMVTGLFGKLAGPIGWVMQAISFAMDIYGDHLKLQAALTRIETKRQEAYTGYLVESYKLTTQRGLGQMRLSGSMAKTIRQAGQQDILDATRLSTGLYSDAVSNVYGSIFGGTNESAYQAAKSSLNFSADVEKTKRAHLLREKNIELQQGIMDAELAKLNAETGLNRRQAALKLAQTSQELAFEAFETKAKAGLTAQAINASGGGSELAKDNTTGKIRQTEAANAENVQGRYRGTTFGSKAVDGVIGNDWATMAASAIGGDLVSAATDMAKAESERGFSTQRQNLDMMQAETERYMESWLQYAQLGADLERTNLETVKQKADTITDAAKKIAESQLELAHSTEKFLDNVDSVVNSMGINMGITNPAQLMAFKQMQLGMGAELAKKWGIKSEDLYKMQNAYIETTGRNRMLSKTDLDKMIGAGRLVGDQEAISGIVSGLQIFNKSASSSVDAMDKILVRGNQMGLNMKKYSKALLDNLKLANKYNFKNGTKGLMEMTLWAEKTRFNMSSLGGMLDKVQEGGLEGVITQAAGFQVLGGHSAMNSDPLGMLFDALADPQSFAKRMQDMTIGFGRFDRRTGETSFNINEQLQMAQIAKLQGRSLEEVRNEVMERNKRQSIESSLSASQASTFTKTQKDLLVNLAAYNDKTQKWEVMMNNGTPKGLDEISVEDLEKLRPKEHEAFVEDRLDKVVTALEIITGTDLNRQLSLAEENLTEYYEAYKERAANAETTFLNNREAFNNAVSEGISKITSSFSVFNQIFEKGNPEIDSEVGKLKTNAGALNNGLDAMNSIIISANVKLTKGFTGLNDALTDAEKRIDKMFHDQQQSLNNGENDLDTVMAQWFGTTGIGAEHSRSWLPQFNNRKEVLKKLKSARTLDDLQEALSGDLFGFGGLKDPLKNYGLINDQNWKDLAYLRKLRDQIIRYSLKDGDRENTHYVDKAKDAFINPIGQPPLIHASNVTPINDGFVQADSDDTFLAAKKGGPVFSKLHNIAKSVSVMGDILYPLAEDIRKFGLANSPQGNAGNKNVNINMGGTLRLEGENGRVVELLLSEMENNPKRRRDFANSVFRAMDEGLNQGRMYFAGTPRNVPAYGA